MPRAARVRCVIDAEICSRGQIVQSDLITTLPAEIQSMIWNNLRSDGDRTCLALTCKANATYYLAIKKPDSRSSTTSQQRIKFLLRLKNFSAHNDLRLCFHCRKFKKITGQWGGMTKYLNSRIVGREMSIKGPKCPPCVKRDHEAQKRIGKSVSRMARN